MRINPPLRIALIYAAVGLLWIFFSDRLLDILVRDSSLLLRFQTLKGTAYVFLTALLLYLLIKRDYDRISAHEREKLQLFRSTMRAVQHILNNFLQNMLYFKIEIEMKKSAAPDIIALYDQVIFETRDEIQRLSSLDVPSEAAIDEVVAHQKQ